MRIIETGSCIEAQRIQKLYDYYGIDCYTFDESEDEENGISQQEIDQLDAAVLIQEGKEVPEDLAARLLKYKAEKENQGGK